MVFVLAWDTVLLISPFVNQQGNDVYSDWLADQWEWQSVLGYSRVPKKRGGGVRIIGGLEMVRYNNNRGAGIIGGGVP